MHGDLEPWHILQFKENHRVKSPKKKPLGANHHEEHLPNSKISVISSLAHTDTMHPNQNSSLTIELAFSQDMIT
jgi:hypothetical protein